jgi:cobalt-zinc-cadmium efflux system outer membrane protein
MYRDFKFSRSPAPIALGGSDRVHRIRVIQSCRPCWKRHRAGLVGVALFALVHLPSVPLRAEIDWKQPITFDRAYQIALAGTPVTALLAAELEAAEGRLEQAGLKPNPSIGAEVENVLGTGPFDGLDRAEVTLGIFQLIERGQKRQRREDLAARSKELLQWDYEEAVALLRYDLRQAFSHALIAQQNVALQAELLELSRESEVEMERLANAARASAIELSQARLATRRQVYHVESARRELREKRAALSNYWNGINPVEFELEGELTLPAALPPFETLRALLEKTPALARFEAEKSVQEASVELARARSHRDVEVFAGARYFNENGGDGALVFGIDIPWQLHDRNQGNIKAALAGRRVVESRQELRRRALVGDLLVAYQ